MDALSGTWSGESGDEVVDASTAARVFAGDGEMAARCRAHDWAATPLGPVERWPAALRTAVRLMLASPVATSLWCGPDYTLIYNDAYRRILGAKHRAALGRSGAAVWDELWPALEPQFAQVRAGGPPVFADDALLRMERLEGGHAEDAWFTYSLSALTDEGGAWLAVFNVAVEITERARAERARDVERARLEEVFRRSPSFLAVLRGPDDVFELANDAYYQFIGRGRDIIGKPLFEALPEVRGQGFEANHRRVRETGEPVVVRDLRVMIRRAADAPPEERFMDVTYLPLVEADGSHEAVIAHGADTTDQVRDRREVERLLAESETARQALESANAQLQDQALELELANQQLQDNAAELEVQAEELQAAAAELEERTLAAEDARRRTEAVLGSIGDAFYLLDRDWRFTYVNDAAEPLLQTTRANLIGRTLWEAFPGVAGSVFEGPYREAMATGRPTSAEAYFAPLGTWFDVHSYPWPGGLMVHFRDIGDRKAAEAERERLLAAAESARAEAEAVTAQLVERTAEREAALARAEAASRAKSDFLAVMSHELRTPLNAIGGYAELIELGIRGPVTEQQREDLARIQRSQRALLGLINEVLNYARLETGAVTYDLTDVPVAEAVAAAEVLVAPQLRARGLGYAWAGGDPGLAVRADRDKLQQILLNLLSNAVKFTNARSGLPGRVEVSCESAAAGADGRVAGPAVRIRVRDTGVGIAPEKLDAVFEPFVQVEATLTRTTEGTGLGLAISRDLARGMGGDLTAESTPGVGSTFTVTLPAAR